MIGEKIDRGRNVRQASKSRMTASIMVQIHTCNIGFICYVSDNIEILLHLSLVIHWNGNEET